MSNCLIFEDMKTVPYCPVCGQEFATQNDVDELEYVNSSASVDIYRCPDCRESKIHIYPAGQDE